MSKMGDFPSAVFQLEVVGWLQNMSTAESAVPTIVMEATKATGSRPLRVPGLGNIMELPFSIKILRGPCAREVAGMPEDAIGILGPHESDQHHGAFVGGNVWLPDAMFGDVWMRTRGEASFDTTVSIEAGPIDQEIDSLSWDRAVSKFLFVKNVSFSFSWNAPSELSRR